MPRTARGGTVRLLRLAPGVSVPHHGHVGTELTLILRGAYADAFGIFGPGDLAEHDEQDRHEPAVAGDEECLCLIATEAPLRFTGLVPRLMQPLFGI
jgi:putative transcriptional regulator